MTGNMVLCCCLVCGYLLAAVSGFRLAEHRRQWSHPDPVAQEKQFYYPTDEGIKDFQQILLRGLGLSAVPDLSKVRIDSPIDSTNSSIDQSLNRFSSSKGSSFEMTRWNLWISQLTFRCWFAVERNQPAGIPRGRVAGRSGCGCI